MKLQLSKLLLLTSLIFLSFTLQSQTWYWHGNPENSTIKRLVQGTVTEMGTYLNCTMWNYGKKGLYEYNIYSYSINGDQVKFKIRFDWHIDYWLKPSRDYAFTLSAKTTRDGYDTSIVYLSDKGDPWCDCEEGMSYDLGRIGK